MASRPFGSLDWARSTPDVSVLLDDIRQASIADAARLPLSYVSRLRAAGFDRIRVPVAEGGLGGSVLDLLDAVVALAAADATFAQERSIDLATESTATDEDGQRLLLLSILVGIGDATRAAAAELIGLIDRAHGETPTHVHESYGRISALVASARASLRDVGDRSEEAHQAIIGGGRAGDNPVAEAIAADARNAAFHAQAVIVEQILEAADRLAALPAFLDDAEETEELRRTLRLDRHRRNAQTIAAHTPVPHLLGTIADHELYDLDRIAAPAERAAVVTTRIAERTRPLNVICVSSELSARLAANRDELDRVAAAFRDREGVLFQFAEQPGARFDGSVAIATWLARFPTSWFAVATADLTHAGHPYNVARRIASLEQLSGGRTAWVVTAEEDERQREYVRVVQQLWRSWPRESIAADVNAAAFAQTDSIRRIGADGAYPVAGPLNVPSSPQHLPVVIGQQTDRDPHRHVDLALRGDAWVLRHDDGAGHPLAREQRADDLAQLLRIAAELPPSDGAPSTTLRARLRLPAPALDELPGASARFLHDSETEAS